MTGPAVGYLIRIELRRRGKSLLALGLLVAVVVAVVVASMAGARRSESAFDRYLESYNSPDAATFGDPGARAELAELDAVEEIIDIDLLAAIPKGVEYLPLYVSDGGAIPFERMHAPVVEGLYLGDTIDLSLGDAEGRVRSNGVVGLPVSADGGSAVEGVYLSPAGVTAFDVDRACKEDPNETCTRAIAVAVRPGTDMRAFAQRYQDTERDEEVGLPRPPGEIDRLTAVEDLPRYMAIFMAALAAAAISFATATTVRQRRRDLAVLRVLGMTGRHVRSVVVVLVLALTGFGALLGGALGVIVGRQVWRAVMGSVSLPFSPSLPVAAVVLVPIAVVVLAQLVASASRRAAGRTPAAMVLRTE